MTAPALRQEFVDRSPLSAEERADLEAREGRMRKSVRAAFEFHEDLAAIFDGRLYRQDYASFDEYLKVRWGITRGHGYRIVEYVKTLAAIGESAADDGEPLATIPMLSETAARPLAGLAPGEKAEAYRVAAEIASAEGKDAPTARHVREAVARTLEDDVRAAKDAGIIPEGAEVYVEGGETPAASAPEPEPAPEVTDEEYLASLPARAGLSPLCRKWFDADALAFRRLTPARLAFARAFSAEKRKAQREAAHVPRWLSTLSLALRRDDPSRWLACNACGGTGQVTLVGKCGACHGHGYVL